MTIDDAKLLRSILWSVRDAIVTSNMVTNTPAGTARLLPIRADKADEFSSHLARCIEILSREIDPDSSRSRRSEP